LASPTDARQQLIDALHEWEVVSMSTSMGAFLQYAKEQGLSVPQIGALIHINSRGTCGVTDIGDDLGVTSAAASQMLERLVQGGLVERGEDPADRRAKRIVLTERGQRLVRGTMEIRQRQFADLADRMSPHERGSTAAALRTLVAHSSALAVRSSPHVAPVPSRTKPKEHHAR
jgi:DNA-binding MarR family transcriptional regulator